MYMYVCTSMMVAGSAAADVASMAVLPPPAANPAIAMASSGFEHLPNSKSCVFQIFIENPLVALLAACLELRVYYN